MRPTTWNVFLCILWPFVCVAGSCSVVLLLTGLSWLNGFTFYGSALAWSLACAAPTLYTIWRPLCDETPLNERGNP